jgi:hypothetical protein
VASCRECGDEPSGSCSMELVCACAPDFAVSDKSVVSNCRYLLKIYESMTWDIRIISN